MSKRVTIMMDENIDKKIRILQANEIRKTGETCSYSKILRIALKKGLK